jgi:uncharacterized protein (DUF1499 family)
MRRLILLFLSVGITLMISVTIAAVPAWAIASPQLAVLPFFEGVFAGQTPNNLGVNEGKLAPCPDSPNCVVSQGGDENHTISPISYDGDRSAVREKLLQVLAVVSGTKIVKQTDNYIRAESASRLLGFVDDLEFYLPEAEKVIQVRSAARLGESDLGVNRRRLEQIRLALQELDA